MKALNLVLFALVILPAVVLAQAAAPAVAEPTYLDGVLKFLQNLSPAVVTAVVAGLEFLLRAFPTSKALSLLIPVRYAVKSLGAILTVLAGFLDQIVQAANNVKAP